MTTQTYHEASLRLLAQAESELADGDVRQASEKGWGAAALAVKAACERRAWRHRTHRHLHEAVALLIEETGDVDLDGWFSTANRLHMNFYELYDGADYVSRALGEVRLFIAKLEDLP